MMISYDEFYEVLSKKIKTDSNFHYELLKTVINNPKRYTGIFRLSNARTKIIQNITQSREIKFGDFMEEIITLYIEKMGYTNIDKNIGSDEEGNDLNADQVFMKDNTIYLIEQKIRDDHDSSKKRGQFQNFQKKYELLEKLYPNRKISACMWFIDNGLVKNKKFYLDMIAQNLNSNITLHLFYGGEIFNDLFNYPEVWQQICLYLSKNKQERNSEVLNIPDFDTSKEMLDALKLLKFNEPNLFKKLLSNKLEYVQLREELFPTGYNLNLL